ncbi:transferase [Trypanosoma cruzi]|nr:transferase [Trypanosoma cruzi]
MALSCARASPCFFIFLTPQSVQALDFRLLDTLPPWESTSHGDLSGCQTHGNRGLQRGQSGSVSGDLRHLILRRVSHALSRVSAPVCVYPMTGICVAHALGKAEGNGGISHGHVSAVRMRKLWTCLCGKAARSLRRSSIDWEYTF